MHVNYPQGSNAGQYKKSSLIYHAEKYAINLMQLVHVKYLNNHGNYAVVLEKNGSKYVLVAVNSCIYFKGKGICKSISKDAVDYCIKNNAQLLFYNNDGNYLWTLNAQKIQDDFDNGLLSEEEINYQKKFKLVPLSQYNCINMVMSRRNSANKIENHLTNQVFSNACEPVIFTGDRMIMTLGRKPDWMVVSQRKVILYMGLHVHTDQQIQQEINDYNKMSYQVYVIRSDEYSNSHMNTWRDKIILDRVNLFISTSLSQKDIDNKIPMVNSVIKNDSINEKGQTILTFNLK